MLILALDTATDKGSLALMADEELLAESSLESAGAYLQRLLPGVEALLQAAGRPLAEVGAIAVSIGPGNFTGLRIGLATAKGLAYALGCPLIPVPTLEALAAQFPYQTAPIGVIMDAKRGEVFFARFRCPEAQPQTIEGPVRLAVNLLLSRLAPPLVLTGPGLNAHEDFLKQSLPPEIQWAPLERRHPRAAQVARLGWLYLAAGLTAAPARLTPTYLRPAL